MFTMASWYRFFAYLNVLIVLISLYFQFQEFGNLKNLYWLKSLLFYPLAIFCLHFFSVQDFVIIKEIRHTTIAIFLAIGLALLARKNHDYLKENIRLIMLLVIIVYIFGQLVAIWGLGKHYGTAKNPHYLALYSSISIIVGIYSFYKSSVQVKLILGICLIILGFLLLETSSRPAWIGLFFSSIIATIFLNKKNMLGSVFSLIVFILFIFFTNLGGFAERSQDLISHISTEERVTIWKETVDMQMDSSTFNWIVGHGIDSFEEDFKPYSSYHQKGIDFNSPHNYILEVLYISGVVGLIIFISFFCILYKKVISCIKKSYKYKDIYLMLFIVLTTHFIFASITLPFFYGPSLNVIAYVIGMLVYLETIQNQKTSYE